MASSATITNIDKGYKQIALNVRGLKHRGVKIGFIGGGTVTEYAIYNEFGTSRMPARPFMGTTADKYGPQVVKLVDQLVGSIVEGKSDIERVLSVMGEWYQMKMQQTIRDAKQWAVPNSPETIAMKGSSSPLIDTGRMLGSVSYEKL